MSKKPRKSSTGLITGLIVGGAVTGVAGMLLSSKENREKTKKIGKQAGNAGLKMIKDIFEKAKKKK